MSEISEKESTDPDNLRSLVTESGIGSHVKVILIAENFDPKGLDTISS